MSIAHSGIRMAATDATGPRQGPSRLGFDRLSPNQVRQSDLEGTTAQSLDSSPLRDWTGRSVSAKSPQAPKPKGNRERVSVESLREQSPPAVEDRCGRHPWQRREIMAPLNLPRLQEVKGPFPLGDR